MRAKVLIQPIYLFTLLKLFLGTCHENITCDGCKTQKIYDLRWKCTDCYDFDLCSSCYHNNSHDINHAFKRIDIPGAE